MRISMLLRALGLGWIPAGALTIYRIGGESLPPPAIDANYEFVQLAWADVDEDRDGLNDRFLDANGDGVNDLGLTPYPHHFPFIDADQDGRNDHFIDADGDGVNDLDGRFIDGDKNGFIDNIIDFNGDRINDITGEHYGPHGLKGYRYGHILEERRQPIKRFIDQDGDGMHDRFKRWHKRMQGMDRRMDFFLDEDGDGINDARFIRRKHGPQEKIGDKLVPKRHPRRHLPPRKHRPKSEQERKPGGRK